MEQKVIVCLLAMFCVSLVASVSAEEYVGVVHIHVSKEEVRGDDGDNTTLEMAQAYVGKNPDIDFLVFTPHGNGIAPLNYDWISQKAGVLCVAGYEETREIDGDIWHVVHVGNSEILAHPDYQTITNVAKSRDTMPETQYTEIANGNGITGDCYKGLPIACDDSHGYTRHGFGSTWVKINITGPLTSGAVIKEFENGNVTCGYDEFAVLTSIFD